MLGSLDGKKVFSLKSEIRTLLVGSSYSFPDSVQAYYRISDDRASTARIYSRDTEGSRPISTGFVRVPFVGEWSPDGQWFTYGWTNNDAWATGLVIADRQGKSERTVTIPVNSAVIGAIWSRDSQFIHIPRVDAGFHFFVNAATGEVTRLPTGKTMDNLTWTKTGHSYLHSFLRGDGLLQTEWGEIDGTTHDPYIWSEFAGKQIIITSVDTGNQMLTVASQTGSALYDPGNYILDVQTKRVMNLWERNRGDAFSLFYISPDRKTLTFRNGQNLVEFDAETQKPANSISGLGFGRQGFDLSFAVAVDDESNYSLIIKDSHKPAQKKALPPLSAQLSAGPGDVLPPTVGLTNTVKDLPSLEISYYSNFPRVWADNQQNIFLAGGNAFEGFVRVYPPGGEMRAFRKPGLLKNVVTLGDWLGVQVDSDNWLWNFKTDEEITLGRGILAIDNRALIFIENKPNDTIEYKMFDAQGRLVHTYHAAGNEVEDGNHAWTTPLRSPDEKHALIFVDKTNPNNKLSRQIGISIYNGDTGQSVPLWEEVIGIRTPVGVARWLPDSSGLLIFHGVKGGVQMVRLTNRGEIVWSRMIPGAVWTYDMHLLPCDFPEYAGLIKLR